MKSALINARTPRFALLIVFLAALGFASTTAPARISEVPGVTIENFGKVNDHYYRGSQPTREQFAELKRFGIKSVIDLRGDFKKEEEGWVRDAGMQFFRIPLKASVAATEEQTKYFLDLVNDPANLPVYVHCKGGRHRTGTLTAVYRMANDGWTPERAYDEMLKYDFEYGFGHGSQKKFVFAYGSELARKSASTAAKATTQQ